MDKMQSRPDIERLRLLLDTFGADRARWPAAERLRLAAFVASDAEARRLVAEAAAFDRLLDMAPRPSPERERAAVARIVAAAFRHENVPWKREPARERPLWRAAAPLAASLVLGVFAGMAGLVPGVEEFAQADAAEGDIQQAVLDDNDGAPGEEELL